MDMNRRTALGLLGAAGAALALPGLGIASPAPQKVSLTSDFHFEHPPMKLAIMVKRPEGKDVHGDWHLFPWSARLAGDQRIGCLKDKLAKRYGEFVRDLELLSYMPADHFDSGIGFVPTYSDNPFVVDQNVWVRVVANPASQQFYIEPVFSSVHEHMNAGLPVWGCGPSVTLYNFNSPSAPQTKLMPYPEKNEVLAEFGFNSKLYIYYPVGTGLGLTSFDANAQDEMDCYRT